MITAAVDPCNARAGPSNKVKINEDHYWRRWCQGLKNCYTDARSRCYTFLPQGQEVRETDRFLTQAEADERFGVIGRYHARLRQPILRA